eukprot:COSAG02_NODE_46962_length_344_cov_9.277551_1_plen_28_part_10
MLRERSCQCEHVPGDDDRRRPGPPRRRA